MLNVNTEKAPTLSEWYLGPCYTSSTGDHPLSTYAKYSEKYFLPPDRHTYVDVSEV